jgi:MFS family permease
MPIVAEHQAAHRNGQSPFRIPNIRLFITFRILFNARFYYPVFTILFLDYGLTIEQFALLNAVWAVTIVGIEIPSGAMADLLGRRRLLVLTSLVMIGEMSLLAFVPLGTMQLVFWAFLVNRVLSGLAEAMASGADEAIAYDSLVEEGNPDHWPRVLSVLMRLQALAGVIAMTVGALIYDPNLVNRLLSWLAIDHTVSQQVTMRFPIYLTLLLAIGTFFTTIGLQERGNGEEVSLASFRKAAALTLQAGWWILRTPFALAVILFGMLYDHLLRLIITLASQYFRLIELPEASFGIIMASFSLLGLLVPKYAEWLVERFSPVANCGWLALLTLATLVGLCGFFPFLGILPMAGVMVGLLLTSFFTSHYLNRVTASALRATVLSFKGMLFNLAYGLIGVLFALLIGQVRSGLLREEPLRSAEMVGNEAFRQSFFWFPWYGLVLAALITAISYRLLSGRQPPHGSSDPL